MAESEREWERVAAALPGYRNKYCPNVKEALDATRRAVPMPTGPSAPYWKYAEPHSGLGGGGTQYGAGGDKLLQCKIKRARCREADI